MSEDTKVVQLTYLFMQLSFHICKLALTENLIEMIIIAYYLLFFSKEEY